MSSLNKDNINRRNRRRDTELITNQKTQTQEVDSGGRSSPELGKSMSKCRNEPFGNFNIALTPIWREIESHNEDQVSTDQLNSWDEVVGHTIRRGYFLDGSCFELRYRYRSRGI